jgi:hypothetical protein
MDLGITHPWEKRSLPAVDKPGGNGVTPLRRCTGYSSQIQSADYLHRILSVDGQRATTPFLLSAPLR